MEGAYYSDKAIVIYGDTKPHAAQLKHRLNAKWNRRLKGGPGWIVPRIKETQVVELTGRPIRASRREMIPPLSTPSSTTPPIVYSHPPSFTPPTVAIVPPVESSITISSSASSSSASPVDQHVFRPTIDGQPVQLFKYWLYLLTQQIQGFYHDLHKDDLPGEDTLLGDIWDNGYILPNDLFEAHCGAKVKSDLPGILGLSLTDMEHLIALYSSLPYKETIPDLSQRAQSTNSRQSYCSKLLLPPWNMIQTLYDHYDQIASSEIYLPPHYVANPNADIGDLCGRRSNKSDPGLKGLSNMDMKSLISLYNMVGASGVLPEAIRYPKVVASFVYPARSVTLNRDGLCAVIVRNQIIQRMGLLSGTTSHISSSASSASSASSSSASLIESELAKGRATTTVLNAMPAGKHLYLIRATNGYDYYGNGKPFVEEAIKLSDGKWEILGDHGFPYHMYNPDTDVVSGGMYYMGYGVPK